jgi:Ca-activated chloride channel family protein
MQERRDGMQKAEFHIASARKTKPWSVGPLKQCVGSTCILVLALVLLCIAGERSDAKPMLPGGELQILDEQGQAVGVCPLKHTEVEADIIGFVSRVRVRQTFYNPLETTIEAVYVFPLPQEAAVDRMVMTVGDRRIVGQIKPREEARAIYEAARARGQVASLLDQERPNIFTQSIANIEPGAQVVIEISYVETLKYEDGLFEFVFPMVVGPRYMPGAPVGKQGTGWAPDTTQVPDASKISPPVAPPGTRAGHDISLTVHIDAGMELFDLRSTLHEITVQRKGAGQATVTLANKTEIPNKDFILHYRTATDAIGDAFLVHTDERGTFFTLILQPPQRVLPEQAMPKEMIFVIDRSGSMSGFPIEKAKETMRLAIERMNPYDTFNLLSFSGGTGRCFPRAVPNTPQNRAIALRYLADLYGSGGTEMMPAIREALGGPHDPRRVRIVAFMTDGYIGNDFAIIDAVRQHAGTARVFAFGIGNSVNRFLLDRMAHTGRGAVEYVTLQSQGEGVVQRFHERIHSPVLTDITIDWGTLPVIDVYPKSFPDLFSNTPILLHGRLAGPAEGTIMLLGRTGTGLFKRQIHVRTPAKPGQHDVLASLWARAKVQDLMMQDYGALQSGTMPENLRRAMTALGVEFGLMTQFTSFVAVEEMRVTVGGELVTITVPVEIPEGVSYEGIFGHRGLASSPTLQSLGTNIKTFLPAPIPGQVQAPFSPRVLRRDELSQKKSIQPRKEEAAERERSLDPAKVALTKLAELLRDLDAKVAQEGQNGNLTIGKLRVIDYKVDVVIYLRDRSNSTLDALKQLGFVQTDASKTAQLVVGTIDVRKLAQLAQLDTVIRVTPVIS